MKMKLRATLATITVVLYIASCTSPAAAACVEIDRTTDRCRSADLRVGNGAYRKGSYGYINLPHPEDEIFWYCGSSKERTAWGGNANRLTFYFDDDGKISWYIYYCW